MARWIKHDKGKPHMVEVAGQKIFICMCGLSKNYPLCDGTHKITHSEEADKCYAYEGSERREVAKNL